MSSDLTVDQVREAIRQADKLYHAPIPPIPYDRWAEILHAQLLKVTKPAPEPSKLVPLELTEARRAMLFCSHTDALTTKDMNAADTLLVARAIRRWVKARSFYGEVVTPHGAVINIKDLLAFFGLTDEETPR